MQGIPNLQARKTNKAGIMRPDFGDPGIESGKAVLKVEDPGPFDPELFRDLQAPRSKCGSREKDNRLCV